MIKDLSFLSRGPKRVKVLENVDKPRTPTQLAKIIGIDRSSVSATLLELEKRELIKCLNPEERMGRLYQTTKKGKEILKEYNKIQL